MTEQIELTSGLKTSTTPPKPGAIVLPLIWEGEKINAWDNMSPEDYHKNRLHVSSTSLRKILKSPALFYQQWTGAITEEETPAMQFGTLAHVAILEPWRFLDNYRVMPTFEGRTKTGEISTSLACKEVKDKRDAWLADLPKNALIVGQEEYDDIAGITNAILKHEDAKACLRDGKTEISGFYRDDETKILCRFRPDFLRFDAKTLVDVKTTKDCEKSAFARDILNRGYHIQMAMYCAGIKAITGITVEYPTLIAVEKKPPYECAVYILDQGAMDLGEAMYRRGLRRLKKCLTTNQWPGYQSRAEMIGLPGYAFTNDEEEILNDEE